MPTSDSTRPRAAMATQAATAPASPLPNAPDQLRRGTSVGRYTIIKPIGAGGMGIVYQAHDPELDRPVAIKLLSPSGKSDDATQQRAADLLREGRVAARLAHPNVVRVYDVGDFGSELFIAMELLEGKTLEEWLDTAAPSLRQRLDVFVMAGRGLAAAHAANLVHGDFKPRNVMVTDDGRVVVLDFGLGRPSELETALDSDHEVRPGTVAGTPAFMAPELFLGEPTTPQSDQFAYCVSLYAALTSKSPFGDRVGAQRFGKAPIPPPRRIVAPRLWRALRRGLAREPDERFPSMDALLTEITPRALRARWAIVAGIGGAVGVASYAAGGRAAPDCEGGHHILATTWGNEVRATLAERHSGHAWDFLADRLDAYADRWVEQWTSACRDRHVLRAQSAELYDRRMLCLESELAGMSAIVDTLVEQNATLPEAISATATLRRPEDCSDTDALLVSDSVPRDPSQREALAALQRDIAHDRALLALPQRRQDLIDNGPNLLERATQLDSSRSRARIQFIVGKAHLDGGDLEKASKTFLLGLRDAEVAGDDPAAAKLASFLVHTEGMRSHPERATAWAEYAHLKIARASPSDGRLEATIASAEGVAARWRGDTKRSIEILEPAVAAYRKAGHVDGRLADLLNPLAVAYRLDGQHQRAIETSLATLEVRRALYGLQHPLVGESLFNLASAYLVAGSIESARRYLNEARTILEADTKSARKLLGVATLLGPILAEEGELDEAAAVLDVAVAKARRQLPAQAYELNAPLVNLAQVAVEQERYEDAIVAAREAIAIAELHRGRDYAPLATDLSVLAKALFRLERYDEAATHLQRAVDLIGEEKARGQLQRALNAARERSAAAQPR